MTRSAVWSTPWPICRQPDEITAVRRRAREVLAPQITELWLESANAHLDGARLVDLLALSGPDDVLDALAVAEVGAFA